MGKNKTMIKGKSITDKIKKTAVGILAGASILIAGEAIAQQHQQQQPQDAQEIQQETQTPFFSEQEILFLCVE